MQRQGAGSTRTAVVGLGDERAQCSQMVGKLGPDGGPGGAGEEKDSCTHTGAGPQGQRKCKLSWDKGGLRRVFEQVSERTTFLFLNLHISYTARMEQVGKRSEGAS